MYKYFACFWLIVNLIGVGACTATQAGRPAEQITPANSTDTEVVPENIYYETSYLADEPGYVGIELGAKVESVLINEETQIKTIYISVPVDPAFIDTLEVTDKKNQPVPHLREPKIIRDYENNNVGVKLYVSPKRNFDFKLKLSNENNSNQ